MNTATLETVSCGISRADALRLMAATDRDLEELLFEREPAQPDKLDLVERAGERFGSHANLISSDQFRFSAQRPARDMAPAVIPDSPPRQSAPGESVVRRFSREKGLGA